MIENHVFDNRNSEQESHHSEQKTEDFIFGLRPVMEAIEAGKTIDKIFVQGGFARWNLCWFKKITEKIQYSSKHRSCRKTKPFY